MKKISNIFKRAKSEAEHEIILPKLLKRYKDKDFPSQLRARFVYYLCISIAGILFPITSYSIISQIFILKSGIQYSVIIPEISVIILSGLFLLLLVKGYFSFAAHLLLMYALAVVWVVMSFADSNALMRLDSVAYILALLSMTPLFFERKINITIYILANIIILFFYLKIFYPEFGLPDPGLIDYFADTTISLIFIGIVSYNILKINRMSLNKANLQIEKLKIAEQALKESEQFRRRVFDSSRIPIIIMDAVTYKFIDCNPAAAKIYGYKDIEETLGKTPLDVSAQEQYDGTSSITKAELYIKKTLKEGSAIFEWKHQKPDGEIWDAEVHLISFTTGEKQFLQFSLLDITERKNAERALSTEKERLLVTLQSIGDGVITTDIEGKVILLNSVAEKLTGWEQADAFRKPLSTIFNIICETTGEKCENPIEKVISTGTMQELASHTMLISKDGVKRIIADSGAPIKDSNGNILGVVLVFRDMTEKQKLIDAAQRAQKLESIGILAGGIAHDFNNLLAGVFGYIKLAQLHSKDLAVNEKLNDASRAMDRAKALTQQLLTFSKGGEPVKKKQSLIPFLEDIVKFSLSGSAVFPNFDIDIDLLIAEFDRNQIAQVIDNLILNAKQAMKESGTISIIARNYILKENERSTLPPGEYIKIIIKDSGTGIPNEILPHIFDPFFTTKSQGHGLGLAMCYSIINRHNGLIEVESEFGKGSTFILYLPAFKNETSEEEKISTNIKPHSGGRILVMDDEMLLREIITEFLQVLGYEVTAVADGESAVNIFISEREAGRPFNALIFDLTIPGGMGGRETIGEIRKIDKDVIAFVSSGYGSGQILSNPKEAGFNATINKPFTIEELSETLEKYL